MDPKKRWNQMEGIKKPGKFNPDREFITQAVNEYLQAGGSIKRVVVDFAIYDDFMVNSATENRSTYEFLNGDPDFKETFKMSLPLGPFYEKW